MKSLLVILFAIIAPAVSAQQATFEQKAACAKLVKDSKHNLQPPTKDDLDMYPDSHQAITSYFSQTRQTCFGINVESWIDAPASSDPCRSKPSTCSEKYSGLKIWIYDMTGVGQAFVMSVWYVEGAPPDKVAEETMPLEKHGVTGVLTDLVGKHSVF